MTDSTPWPGDTWPSDAWPSGIAPTGRLGSALHSMRSLIAGTETWAAWCGAGVTPSDRIFLQATTTANQPLPFAMMGWAGDLSATRDDIEQRGFVRSGSIMFGIDAAVPASESQNDSDAITGFWNRLDALMDEIEKTSFASAGILITGWTVNAGPERIVAEQRAKHGDRIQVDIALSVVVYP